MRYDELRLRDSRNPGWSLADRMETFLGLRAHYQDPTPPKQKDDGGGDTPPAGDPPPDTGDDLGDDLDLETIDKDKVKAIIADRRDKNRRLQKMQSERASMEQEKAELLKAKSELDELKRKEMNDAEKAQADLEKAQKELEAERAERAREYRLRLVAKAQVKSEYESFYEHELAKAMGSNGDKFNTDDWFKEEKEKRPAFFGDDPALPTATGPPRSGPSTGADRARERLDVLSKLQNPREEDQTEMMLLRQELQRIDAGGK